LKSESACRSALKEVSAGPAIRAGKFAGIGNVKLVAGERVSKTQRAVQGQR
jgi:hypothetical protein